MHVQRYRADRYIKKFEQRVGDMPANSLTKPILLPIRPVSFSGENDQSKLRDHVNVTCDENNRLYR